MTKTSHSRVTVRTTGPSFRRYGTGPTATGFSAGTVTVDDVEGFVVEVAVDHDKATGRPAVQSWKVDRIDGGPAATVRAMHALPLGAVFRLAVEVLSFPAPTDPESGATGARDLWAAQLLQREPDPAMVRRFLGHDGAKGPRGPEDRARRVKAAATAYKKAQAKGRPTTVAVQAACEVGPSLARKLVAEARSKGLLPPTGGTTRPKL